MYAVVAVYPNGARILVGFAHNHDDVNGLIGDCITANGRENLQAACIRFRVELAG